MLRIAKKSIVFFVVAAMMVIPFSSGVLAAEYFETKEDGVYLIETSNFFSILI